MKLVFYSIADLIKIWDNFVYNYVLQPASHKSQSIYTFYPWALQLTALIERSIKVFTQYNLLLFISIQNPLILITGLGDYLCHTTNFNSLSIWAIEMNYYTCFAKAAPIFLKRADELYLATVKEMFYCRSVLCAQLYNCTKCACMVQQWNLKRLLLKKTCLISSAICPKIFFKSFGTLFIVC